MPFGSYVHLEAAVQQRVLAPSQLVIRIALLPYFDHLQGQQALSNAWHPCHQPTAIFDDEVRALAPPIVFDASVIQDVVQD